MKVFGENAEAKILTEKSVICFDVEYRKTRIEANQTVVVVKTGRVEQRADGVNRFCSSLLIKDMMNVGGNNGFFFFFSTQLVIANETLVAQQRRTFCQLTSFPLR